MRKLRWASNAEVFPVGTIILYFVYVGVQGIFSTYFTLYFDSIGLTQSQIGMMVSVSTLLLLVAQMLFGVASDRAKYKNTILVFMLLACSLSVLLFYASKNFWYLLLVMAIYTCFQSGSFPLLDSIALETTEGKKWNYGQLRAGGTAGYCVVMLLIGYVIGQEYAKVFGIIAAAMFLCFVLATRMPRVEGGRRGDSRTPFRALFSNKPLMAMFAFWVAYSMGQNFYLNFYPVYFTQIGGTSGQIGMVMFFSAIAEIPSLMLAQRVVRRFGTDRVMIACGLMAFARLTLLSFLTNPPTIMAVNLLQGPAYMGVSYCILTYINAHVPKDMRTTSQSFNALLGSVFSRLIFGYVGGLASEKLGAGSILLTAGIMMLFATGIFGAWARARRKEFV